jgi:hypothetical protein
MQTQAVVAATTAALARTLAERLQQFLSPLLLDLDAQLDKRLVRTFAATVQAIVQMRNRASGLLLSELGGVLLSPQRAPAGTKRLSRLLHSHRWGAELIAHYLWSIAGRRIAELECQGEDALLIWDESVLEKPESVAAAGLGSVRSTKAARLKRIKPGFYTPPGGPPVFVPGLHWLATLLIGRAGPPVLASMRWWTNRGALTSDRRTEEALLLRDCVQAWGRRVIHVFDRGFCGGPWLQHLAGTSHYAPTHMQARFILRWQKHYSLHTPQGQEQKAWQIARGKRTQERRSVPGRGGVRQQMGVLALPVCHPDYPGTLWLVISRPGAGRAPWYLLTNEPIRTCEDAWRVVFAYARRWQIEMAYRFGKSELAMQSPRLWSWIEREKLLLMASLAYAFLLSLLRSEAVAERTLLLRHGCHRTGKRSRDTPTPLYRIRAALSYLWNSVFNPVIPLLQNSG